MRTIRVIRAAIALAALAAVTVAPAPGRAANLAGGWTSLAGESHYDDGVFIYQDFVYDDYGADTRPAGSPQRVTLASTIGDFRYPADARYAANAADIGEVRAEVTGGDDLAITVQLGALIDATTTVIGVAIDTGAGTLAEWPDGAGVSSVWDVYAQARASGGSIFRPSPSAAMPVAADTDANTFAFTIPDVAGGDRLSLVIGAGLAGPGSAWMTGSPAAAVPGTFDSGAVSTVRVFDLAFNSRALEPRGGAWQEDAQARALTLGDVSAYSQTLQLDDMRAGLGLVGQPTRGFYNRIFTSRQNLGEGTAGSFPQYRSKRTPYGLWIPAGYDSSSPTPLILQLHSLSVHHNQYRGGQGATSYFTMYEQLGDGLGAIVATPLGGGPDGWYRNESLVDALEVLMDVQANYDIDPDRIYIAGYSMGGYGTYRIATLFPELFAGAVSWAGVPTDLDRLENLHSIPTMIVHGTNDELVPITGVRAQANRLRELGYEYRFHEHPGMDHLSFVWTDEWSREREWLSGRTRVRNPAVVHFKIDKTMWTTGIGSAAREQILGHIDSLGLDLVSSYWVGDVEPIVTGKGEVLAVSSAIAERSSMGPSDGVALGPPTPHITQGLDRTATTIPTYNSVEVWVRDVLSLTVDAARAGLDIDERILLTSDNNTGGVVHTLTGGFSGSYRVDNGTSASVVTASDGAITFTVAVGRSGIAITRV